MGQMDSKTYMLFTRQSSGKICEVVQGTLRRLIIVHRGANNEYTGGPGGPGTGFCGPGGGLVVINVVASHYVY